MPNRVARPGSRRDSVRLSRSCHPSRPARRAPLMADQLALRAAQEAILASGSTLAGPGGLCGPCVELLPVTGAAVCTLSGPINNETVCASDDVAFRIDELQFD